MEMAAGVIAAKARSMLGEQLSAQDYEELLHKRSVAEIAAYLKNGTSYACPKRCTRKQHSPWTAGRSFTKRKLSQIYETVITVNLSSSSIISCICNR